MAAPKNKTLQDLNGNWTLNAKLSDDPTLALKLQDANYLVRKAATSASVHLEVSQSADGNHILMKQNATSFKLPGTAEEYILDWQWRESKDPVFGDLQGRSTWINVEEVKGVGADGDWIKGDSCGKLIQAEGNKPDGSWGGTHYWGFETVGGERRHVRRIRIWRQDGEEVLMRMVYDYDGK